MIDPRNLTMQQWFDAVLLDNASDWSFGTLLDERHWQDHAAGFVRALPFAQRALPDPYMFSDWRDWAMRVYPMLEDVG